jgi:hypothetical protein
VADPTSPRIAYVLTKIAVFLLAAALTWPLSRVVGAKAWWGLAVFGVILAVMTVVVFFALGRSSSVDDDPGDEPGQDTEAEDHGLASTVELEIGDNIDLHSFPPRDIPGIVADYLEAAHAKGIREVRLIHGRGIGVQRERVRSVLSKHPLVESFSDATPDRGGWGATVACLTPDPASKFPDSEPGSESG